MSSLIVAALLSIQLPDPPGLVTRVGTTAFRPYPARTLMATSPDGSRLYTASLPMNCLMREFSVNHLAVVDAATGRVLASYPTPWWSHSDCYEFGDGELRLLVHERGAPTAFLRVVDLNTGRVVREGKPWRLPGDGKPSTRRGLGLAHPGRICWSPSSKLLALTAPDDCVEIWDVDRILAGPRK